MSAIKLACLLACGAAALAHADPKLDAAVDARIASGLVLLRDGKFDDWIATHCSTSKLCVDESQKVSLKRYNLPVMKKRAPRCLRDGDKLEIDRREGSDTEVKVFVKCETTALPIPFKLINEGGVWKFTSI